MKTYEDFIREKFEKRRRMLCTGITNLRKAADGLQACVDMEALSEVNNGYTIGLPVKSMQEMAADMKGHGLAFEARLFIHTAGQFAIYDEKHYQDEIDRLKDALQKQEQDLKMSPFMTASTAYKRAAIETKLDELVVLEMMLSDARADYDDYAKENGIDDDDDDDEQEEE